MSLTLSIAVTSGDHVALLLMQERDNGDCSGVSSSYVWICMTGQGGTEVCVANANNLADTLDKFHVSSSHVLCIAAVPGTTYGWVATGQSP